MARAARFVFPGHPHHVTQEAGGGRTAFATEADYRLYLDWLAQNARRYGVEIWAYCLTPDRVDVVCVPRSGRSLARTFNVVHMRYALRINGRTGERGPLWKPRFMSCVLDGPSAKEDVRFVETIPVRAGIVSRAEDYPWSSVRSRIDGDTGSPATSCPWASNIDNWRAFLLEPSDEPVLARVRERLKTGRPAGDAEFVRDLEAASGRRLEALPRGRPRKTSRA